MKHVSWIAPLGATLLAGAAPALAQDVNRAAGFHPRPSAFTGATLRMEFGASRRAAPEARLGVGMLRERRDAAGFYLGSKVSPLTFALGAEDGQAEFFAGSEPLSRSRSRLGMAEGSSPLLLLGGIAAGAVAIVLLTGGDDEDEDDGPCPPGVEVCAF